MELDFLDEPAGSDEPVRVEQEPAQASAEQPEAAVPETPAAGAEEQADPQPRGPDGKFAPKKERSEPGHIPITALLEERDRRKAAEERLKAFEQQQQARPAPPPGSPEYFAQVEQSVEQRLVNERLNFSEKLARKEYGQDTVQAAQQWALERFQTDPGYQQKVLGQPDPYEFVVLEFKQQQALSALSDPAKLDAFLAWQAQQSGQTATPSQQPQSAPPPRSLASAPSAGVKPGASPVGEGVAFDTLFTR